MEIVANIEQSKLKAFIQAGSAIITVTSHATGNHLTYRITKRESFAFDTNGKYIYLVGVLSGRDNTKDYTYLGIITANNQFQLTLKSRHSRAALTFCVFDWLWRNIDHPKLYNAVTVQHEGYCCVCGRKLTDPLSIQLGIGPDCRKTRRIKTFSNFADDYLNSKGITE